MCSPRPTEKRRAKAPPQVAGGVMQTRPSRRCRWRPRAQAPLPISSRGRVTCYRRSDVHVRPYVHKRGGAEPKMPRAKPHQLAVTIGVGYLRLFGGAHTNCTPVAATATVADPSTGTNAAAPPSACACRTSTLTPCAPAPAPPMAMSSESVGQHSRLGCNLRAAREPLHA